MQYYQHEGRFNYTSGMIFLRGQTVNYTQKLKKCQIFVAISDNNAKMHIPKTFQL